MAQQYPQEPVASGPDLQQAYSEPIKPQQNQQQQQQYGPQYAGQTPTYASQPAYGSAQPVYVAQPPVARGQHGTHTLVAWILFGELECLMHP